MTYSLPVLLVEGEIGGGVVEDGFLSQIVPDHLGHEVVDALIIGGSILSAGIG